VTSARANIDGVSAEELHDVWATLAADERAEAFELLRAEEQADFFLNLRALGQAQILLGLPEPMRKTWMRILPPDDAADVLQEVDAKERELLAALLDDVARHEVNALLAYAEDRAGGLMSPRFARARPDMRADETIHYLRRQAHDRLETISYIYVLDAEQRVVGVCSFREIFSAPAHRLMREVMYPDPVVVDENLDQEEVAQNFLYYGYSSLPVVDADGRMKGIVTIDDIVDVVQEEATEDAQKFGGMEALDAPYFQTTFGEMIKKRAGWLAILFVGEMFTASAMGNFEDEIAKAVVLALFVPLIISSGGNSGSQASTLIIRAMTLGEVKLRDWWRIVRRELTLGVILGVILATIGVIRILSWQYAFGSYGEHYGLVAITVGVSLIGVVTWGTLSGSMLPFILRRAGVDPASASAPFVATLVDVSGLVIYFEVAKIVMRGTLL